jgi:ABC-type phosphate transport system substrate-binding protein
MKTTDTNKFQSVLASTLSVTAALLCVTALSTQTANAQTITRSIYGCVSIDPRANNGQPAPAGFVVNTTCQQYFAAGATIPAHVYRNFFDWFGITIPGNGPGECQATGQADCQASGLQPLSPANSPQFAGRSIQINYCLTGSGTGRNLFTGSLAGAPITCHFSNGVNTALISTPGVNDPLTISRMPIVLANNGNFSAGEQPTFAGTDTPLTQAEINTYTTSKCFGDCSVAPIGSSPSRGNPIQLPAIITPVAVSVNATSPGSGLRLSTADLCLIFNGIVTTYNVLTPPSTPRTGPITVVVIEGSNTTNIFTSYLANECPKVIGPYYITTGLNTFPLARFLVRFTSEKEAADYIAATPGAIGYNTPSFVSPFASGGPLTTLLPNPAGSGTFFSPTNVNGTINGTTGLTIEKYATKPDTTLYPCVYRVAGLLPSATTGTLLPTPITSGVGYPILGASNILLYTNYDPTARTAVASVFNRLFGVVSAGSPFPNDAIAQANGSFVIRSGTSGSVTNSLRGMLAACVNTTQGNLTRIP